MQKFKCSCCKQNAAILTQMKFSNGVIHYPKYCPSCDVKLEYVTKEFADAYIAKYGEPDTLKTGWQKRGDGVPPCERCGDVATELHHWAPQHLFDDANDWPMSYLCRSCHNKWHGIVTPNMSHHKSSHKDEDKVPEMMESLLSKRNMLRSRLGRK